jgi:protein-S-isoprenylcysteine O-methyltransferase Ste14
MNLRLLFLAIILELIYLLLFVLTIKLPHFRFWPPPSPYSWQFILAWLIVGIVGVCGFLVGWMNNDSAFLPEIRIRLPLAGIFIVFGCIIGGWGNVVFGLRATLGLGNRLVIKGPYKYTRNPQYIGDSMNIIGYMLLTNSWMVWVIGILAVSLNLLAPFVEEPWLEAHYGEYYRDYKRGVPRWLCRRSKDIV